MSKKINLKATIGAIISFGVAYITATGTILNYINFADPLNEMGFCILALIMGVGCLMCIKK